MFPVFIVLLLLLYLPFRISRGFPTVSRVTIVMIVAAKAALLVILHFNVVNTTGHPIVMDQSLDARRYYDVGEAFANYRVWDITRNDIVRERGADSHLGYFVINIAAFQICPTHPMLFLRLAKLLLFHIGLGMLATTWRLKTNETRAFWGYVAMSVMFYQFFYYHFRNFKDDVILALFMIVMALVDRMSGVVDHQQHPVRFRRIAGNWIAVAVITWALSTIRYYLGLAIVCAFAIHTVTGRGMKIIYRVLLAGVIAVGFILLIRSSGFLLVEERGGVSAITGALSNVYGLFKIFVTPFPWQQTRKILMLSQTFYLLMLAPVLWAFLMRLRSNLDWKLYVVLAVAIVVGGQMQNFNPRKRSIMYPVFIGWLVTSSRKRRPAASEEDDFDLDLYFARRSRGWT